VIVTAEHAEPQGIAAGKDMEEWLLLDRVDLHPTHVAVWDVENPVLVKPDLAYPLVVRSDLASMATRDTAESAILHHLIEVPFSDTFGESIAKADCFGADHKTSPDKIPSGALVFNERW